MVERHRVRLGDQFRIFSFSSVAVDVRARVTVEFDDGRLRDYSVKITTASDGTSVAATFGVVEKDGRVVRALATRITPTTKRGQCYVGLETVDRNGATVDGLCRDYLYESNLLNLDRYLGAGPGEGNGHIFKNAIADDIAPVDIQHTFGISNTLRRIDGFIWYYHASGDVASRTLRVSARDFGEGLPTGMTSGGNTLIQVWPNAGNMGLTADQEGFVYVNAESGQNFAISADNGARTTEDTFDTTPLPFPYWANENDVGELFFDVTSANANDRHSIYIIEERWIDP